MRCRRRRARHGTSERSAAESLRCRSWKSGRLTSRPRMPATQPIRFAILPIRDPAETPTYCSVRAGSRAPFWNDLLALLSDRELPKPFYPVSSPDGNLLLPGSIE